MALSGVFELMAGPVRLGWSEDTTWCTPRGCCVWARVLSGLRLHKLHRSPGVYSLGCWLAVKEREVVFVNGNWLMQQLSPTQRQKVVHTLAAFGYWPVGEVEGGLLLASPQGLNRIQHEFTAKEMQLARERNPTWVSDADEQQCCAQPNQPEGVQQQQQQEQQQEEGPGQEQQQKEQPEQEKKQEQQQQGQQKGRRRGWLRALAAGLNTLRPGAGRQQQQGKQQQGASGSGAPFGGAGSSTDAASSGGGIAGQGSRSCSYHKLTCSTWDDSGVHAEHASTWQQDRGRSGKWLVLRAGASRSNIGRLEVEMQFTACSKTDQNGPGVILRVERLRGEATSTLPRSCSIIRRVTLSVQPDYLDPQRQNSRTNLQSSLLQPCEDRTLRSTADSSLAINLMVKQLPVVQVGQAQLPVPANYGPGPRFERTLDIERFPLHTIFCNQSECLGFIDTRFGQPEEHAISFRFKLPKLRDSNGIVRISLADAQMQVKVAVSAIGLVIADTAEPPKKALTALPWSRVETVKEVELMEAIHMATAFKLHVGDALSFGPECCAEHACRATP